MQPFYAVTFPRSWGEKRQWLFAFAGILANHATKARILAVKVFLKRYASELSTAQVKAFEQR